MKSGIHPAVNPALHRKTVIVVDDSPIVLNFLGVVLRSAGHHVFEASCAEMAKAYASNGHRVDLLVTDYEMPGTSGVALAKWFRDRWPEMPVLLVTGSPAAALGDAGFHPSLVCIAKPCLQHEIVRTVEEMFVAGAH